MKPAYRTRATALAAGVPLLILMSVYVLAVLARLDIGKWPSYGMPDPKDLPQPLLAVDIVVTLAFLSLFPLSLLAAIVFLVSFFPRFRWMLGPSIAWILSAALTIWVSSLDIGGVFTWLMD